MHILYRRHRIRRVFHLEPCAWTNALSNHLCDDILLSKQSIYRRFLEIRGSLCAFSCSNYLWTRGRNTDINTYACCANDNNACVRTGNDGYWMFSDIPYTRSYVRFCASLRAQQIWLADRNLFRKCRTGTVFHRREHEDTLIVLP